MGPDVVDKVREWLLMKQPDITQPELIIARDGKKIREWGWETTHWKDGLVHEAVGRPVVMTYADLPAIDKLLPVVSSLKIVT